MSKVEPGWRHPRSSSVPVAPVSPTVLEFSAAPPVAVLSPPWQRPPRPLRSRSVWPQRCPPLRRRPRSGGVPMAVAHRSSSGVPDGGGTLWGQRPAVAALMPPSVAASPGRQPLPAAASPSRGGAIPVPRVPAVYLRKLADDEQPLRLRLLAGPSEKALSFVLKENESGEVNVSAAGEARGRAATPCAAVRRSGAVSPQWDAFSLPELHNFLRILQREEDEQLRRVRHRYARCRRELQAALAARTPG